VIGSVEASRFGLGRRQPDAALLQRAGKEAAHGVRLPSGGRADRLDGRAGFQHPDHLGLLAVLTRAALTRWSAVGRWLGRASRFVRIGIDRAFRARTVRPVLGDAGVVGQAVCGLTGLARG